MAYDWKEYQDEAASFFRSLGLIAETDVRLQGVRTTHDIDVVVRSRHVGFEVLWLVECKHWKSSVSKLHVLGLREIVNDLGADRGILLCEAGFQAGAIEAANLTNVQVTSLASLSVETLSDVSAMRLRDLSDRVGLAKSDYWELDKSYRIKVGLRADAFEHSYSGTLVIQYCETVLAEARRNKFPIEMGGYSAMVNPSLPTTYNNAAEVSLVLDPMIRELEMRLKAAYAVLK
jgi:hypothetical protein